MEKIRVGIFNPEKPKIEFLEIEKGLDSYYKLINCRMIDIVNWFGIDMVVDDEGLIYDKPVALRYLNGSSYFHLVGTIIFVSYDDEGDTVSLNPNVERILREISENNIVYYEDENEKEMYYIELDATEFS